MAMRDTSPFSDLILTFLLKYNSVVSIKRQTEGAVRDMDNIIKVTGQHREN